MHENLDQPPTQTFSPLVFHVVANTPEAAKDLEELCLSIHRSIPNAIFIDYCQSLESYREELRERSCQS